jgi:hypothetical protein
MNLIETLIRELASLKEASPHIPLAVLAAVNGLSLISNDARKLIVNSSLSGLCLDKNYASRVFIAYLVCHDIIGTDDKYYKLGARLLSSTALSLSSRLKALFLETLSPLGNPHSGEIPLLLDDLMRNQKASESQVRDALDSFDHIEDLVNQV